MHTHTHTYLQFPQPARASTKASLWIRVKQTRNECLGFIWKVLWERALALKVHHLLKDLRERESRQREESSVRLATMENKLTATSAAYLLLRLCPHRRPSCQAKVEQAAQRPAIGCNAHAVALDQLWGQVRRCAFQAFPTCSSPSCWGCWRRHSLGICGDRSVIRRTAAVVTTLCLDDADNSGAVLCIICACAFA